MPDLRSQDTGTPQLPSDTPQLPSDDVSLDAFNARLFTFDVPTFRLAPPCRGGCLDVQLVIDGGVPPYEVQWKDGDAGLSRTFCFRDGGQAVEGEPYVDVRDRNGRRRTESVAVIPPVCGKGEATYWNACYTAFPAKEPCADWQTTFQIPRPLEADASVELAGYVEVPSASPIAASVRASDRCASPQLLGIPNVLPTPGEDFPRNGEWQLNAKLGSRASYLHVDVQSDAGTPNWYMFVCERH